MTNKDKSHHNELYSPRRGVLKAGLASALGLTIGVGHDSLARAADETRKGPPAAMSCIVLWMNGGPSHIDTFDPKRGAVAGPLKARRTRVPGLEISEHLPQLADQADQFAIIRSMTSKEGNHKRARELVHTGYAPTPTVAHPSMGAWISEARQGRTALPSFISIGSASHGAGFLGVHHGPFVLRRADKPPENVAYGFGVEDTRFDRRLAALEHIDKGFSSSVGDRSVKNRSLVRSRAVAMMRAPELEAFALDAEADAVKAAYGDSRFGRGCLLARRLVERHVPVVEVTLDGWDTHQDNFERVKKQMGILDPAVATLLRELRERDLMRTTLVVLMGEFGRTPKINGRGGRDHYPGAWSAVLAGGGIRGGQVYGATDERGEKVIAKATGVPDLMATILDRMGLDTSRSVMTILKRSFSMRRCNFSGCVLGIPLAP